MMLSKQSLDDSLFDDDFTWDEYKPSPTTNITTEKPLTNICQSGCFDEYAKYADFDDSFEMTPEEQQRMTQVLKDMENSNNTSQQTVSNDMAIEAMINNAIRNVFDEIDASNAIQNELTKLNKTGYAEILQNIIADLNNHVGQLQTILKDVAPASVEIDNGKFEAQQIINNNNSNNPAQVHNTPGYVDMSADPAMDYDDEL